MQSIIQNVYTFNQKANLLNGYSDDLETAFQIEEALEGFAYLTTLHSMLDPINIISVTTAKDVSRAIVSVAKTGNCRRIAEDYISDVDRLDKACDSIIFALGSMAKLGLTPEQIEQALHIVTTANLQKLDMPKDPQGKLLKPISFVGPEIQLQELLDQRSKE